MKTSHLSCLLLCLASTRAAAAPVATSSVAAEEEEVIVPEVSPEPASEPESVESAEEGASFELPGVEPSPEPAQSPQSAVGVAEEERVSETIRITGRRDGAERIAGSAHFVDEETLERFEYDDIQRYLTKVPGVYVRDEDGFGLRPNIGIRGVSSDRSAKIVLMEDGVLLGPAPYSAPAAYFTPLMTRMTGLEIFKGPSAIRAGPYTVGGAINYLTAEVPEGRQLMLDVAGGQYGYMKGHARAGWGDEIFGVLLEGVQLRSTGFKQLDEHPEANTGFDKTELMAKARLGNAPWNPIHHRLELKVGYAHETSRETYLGLTEEDFRDNPYRRYAASALGRMKWDRTQIELSYHLFLGSWLEARLTAYRHDFDRAWRKLNRFTDGTDPNTALRSSRSSANGILLELLRGGLTSAEAGENLLIGTNDRAFVSQGVQLDGWFEIPLEELPQEVRFGARIHYDEIRRLHTEEEYEMQSLAGLVSVGQEAPVFVNWDSATAFSAYLMDELTLFDALTLGPGVRLEVIDSVREAPVSLTDIDGERTRFEGSSAVVLPGIGAHLRLTDRLGLLAGVHRGFSPVAPGQPDEVEPELSVNYELGARFLSRALTAELIGFFNDYSNLLVGCTISQGCNDDVTGGQYQFNAGQVFVYGFESAVHFTAPIHPRVDIGLDATYTLTLSEMQNDFTSQNPQFEVVNVGDRLPYLPEHQASIGAWVEGPVLMTKGWIGLTYTFVDRMRDRASQGDVGDLQQGGYTLTELDFTDVQHIVDLAGYLEVTSRGRLYLSINNLFDAQYVASRRPYGARPGQPFNAQVGFKYNL